MATITIKSNRYGAHTYGEFSAPHYKGAGKTDVAETILTALPIAKDHAIRITPLVGGVAAKFKDPVSFLNPPGTKGIGYNFYKAVADNIVWGRDIQYFGTSAFV